MEILELTPEQIKEIKERFKKNPSNLSMKEGIQLRMQSAIDDISYQVTINGESFAFIWSLWIKETTLTEKYRDHVKEQAIKKINAHDKAMRMYRCD